MPASEDRKRLHGLCKAAFHGCAALRDGDGAAA
jgi:hypothetical protein